jgi:glycosyltransferase involved in cell wall biosynthesis
VDKPFFTVVIPTYNRAELLPDAIQSVLDQSYKHFELLIVDDHSTDNTRVVVQSFADDRITYIVNQRNKGVSGARNTGIFRAKGEWVAFLDSDDVWLPTKLALLYNKTQEIEPDTGLIYTGSADYDFASKNEIFIRIPEREGRLQHDLLYKNFIGTMSIVAIRSNILKQIGGCDERMHFFEDGDLYVRVAGSSRIACIKEKLTYYRMFNPDKLSYAPDTHRLYAYRHFWEKHKEVINGNPRLRHRAASRVFQVAVTQGKMADICKSLPWMLAGLMVDVPNFTVISRQIALALYQKRIRLRPR